jgi:DNA-binding HxlR family transcriptional regulator
MRREWQQARAVFELLGGRWTLAILAELMADRRRYLQLETALDGISHKVLTDTLRRAERDGLVIRNLDLRHVEAATMYELTPLGRSVNALLDATFEWSDEHWHLVEAARDGWENRSIYVGSGGAYQTTNVTRST